MSLSTRSGQRNRIADQAANDSTWLSQANPDEPKGRRLALPVVEEGDSLFAW